MLRRLWRIGLYTSLILAGLHFAAPRRSVSQNSPSPDPVKKPAVDGKGQSWYGVIATGAADLRIVLDLERQPNGSVTGTLRSLDQGGKPIPLEQVRLDDQQLSLSVPSIQGSYQGKFTSGGKSIDGTWKQGGQELKLALRPITELPKDKTLAIWKGTLEAGGQKLELQYRIVETLDGKNAYFDSITQRVMGLKAVRHEADGKLVFEVPMIQGRFEGKLNEAGNMAVGEWKQVGVAFPLTMKATDQVAAPPKRTRPQTPQAPFPYERREVTIENKAAGLTLAGTLTIPKGSGPFPAVVLVSGSGPQDRDESLLGHKPFWVLADHLSRQGIAVLRYDDRGTGTSTGDFAKATTADFARDARAAVEFLRVQPHVDTSRVGIVGHSEGGLVASILSASDVPLAHVVLLAGPGVPGDKILATQTRAIMGKSELTGELAEQQLRIGEEVAEAVKRGASADELKTMIQAFVKKNVGQDLQSDDAREAAQSLFASQLEKLGGPWFAYFLTYDPSKDLRRARCPVLALIGELDLQVLPDVNMPAIREALTASGRTDFRCEILPGLNHLFQSATTGSPAEYEAIEETFAPNALDVVTRWILEH